MTNNMTTDSLLYEAVNYITSNPSLSMETTSSPYLDVNFDENASLSITTRRGARRTTGYTTVSPTMGFTYTLNAGHYVWVYFAPVLFCLGMTGNFLIFLVMRRKAFNHTSTGLYMTLMAIMDSSFLVVGMLFDWIDYCFFVTVSELNEWMCKIYRFALYGFSDVAIWLVVAFSFDRFIAICFPLKKSTFCVRKRAYLAFVILILLTITKNAHVFWTRGSRYYPNGFVAVCATLLPYVHFESYIRPWIAFTMSSLAPFVAILTCNSLMVRSLVLARRSREQNLVAGGARKGGKTPAAPQISGAVSKLSDLKTVKGSPTSTDLREGELGSVSTDLRIDGNGDASRRSSDEELGKSESKLQQALGALSTTAGGKDNGTDMKVLSSESAVLDYIGKGLCELDKGTDKKGINSSVSDKISHCQGFHELDKVDTGPTSAGSYKACSGLGKMDKNFTASGMVENPIKPTIGKVENDAATEMNVVDMKSLECVPFRCGLEYVASITENLKSSHSISTPSDAKTDFQECFEFGKTYSMSGNEFDQEVFNVDDGLDKLISAQDSSDEGKIFSDQHATPLSKALSQPASNTLDQRSAKFEEGGLGIIAQNLESTAFDTPKSSLIIPDLVKSSSSLATKPRITSLEANQPGKTSPLAACQKKKTSDAESVEKGKGEKLGHGGGFVKAFMAKGCCKRGATTSYRQTSFMSISVSLAVLVGIAPSMLMLIFKPYWSAKPWYLQAKMFTNFIVYIHHCTNFALFCLSGQRFRTELVAMFNCCQKPNS